MMHPPLALEILGYVASVMVALSLMMASIVKLRWTNLIGATLLSTYGFLFGDYPIAFLNLFIAGTDIFYLIRMYTRKEQFCLLAVSSESPLVQHFFQEHQVEIQAINPQFNLELLVQDNVEAFLLLRNDVTAGFMIGKAQQDHYQLFMDFVLPSFRDFRPGFFLHGKTQNPFVKRGFQHISTVSHQSAHQHYLRKMGFRNNDSQKPFHFTKSI